MRARYVYVGGVPVCLCLCVSLYVCMCFLPVKEMLIAIRQAISHRLKLSGLVPVARRSYAAGISGDSDVECLAKSQSLTAICVH